MFVKWMRSPNKGRKCGALFIDFFKAFDHLSFDSLIAKIVAYEFSYSSLILVSSFLSNKKYRTKVKSAYCHWEDL